MGVQALAAIAGVYPLQIVPRLVQLCALLAGSSLADDEMEVDGEVEGDEEEDEGKKQADDDESEDEDEEVVEAGSNKEEYRYNLLLLVLFNSN
jgi:hypothetical protein